MRFAAERLEKTDNDAWAAFLASSNNGTLFHDLDFLAYHPPGRCNFHHLLFRADGDLVGLLPACITEDRILCSPAGASVGGLVLLPGAGLDLSLGMIHALQEYAVGLGLRAVTVRLGLSVYMREPDDVQSYALAAAGFCLERRWLCHAVPVPRESDSVEAQCSSRRLRYARSALKHGVRAAEVGPEAVPEFHRMLVKDREKFGAVPTHAESEIRYLMERLPGRVRLFLADYDGQAVAGLLLLDLNDRCASVFYLCQDDSQSHLRANVLLMVHVLDLLRGSGYRYLDLGPSTFDDYSVNSGLTRFKEDFGGRGWCRDAWRWDAP